MRVVTDLDSLQHVWYIPVLNKVIALLQSNVGCHAVPGGSEPQSVAVYILCASHIGADDHWTADGQSRRRGKEERTRANGGRREQQGKRTSAQSETDAGGECQACRQDRRVRMRVRGMERRAQRLSSPES